LQVLNTTQQDRPQDASAEVPKRATIAYAGFMENAGGVVTHTKLLSKALADCGYAVTIVSLDSIPYFMRFIPHAAWFLLRPIDGILAIYVKQRLARLFLRNLSGKDVGDLMVFQDIYIPWQTPAKQLIIVHALWSDNLQSLHASRYSIEQFSKWEASLLNFSGASAVTVSRPYRDHIYSYLNQYGLRRSIGVIEPGIDGPSDSALPASGVPGIPGEIRMLYVGALEHRKNVAFLLEVVAELHRQGTPVTLGIVGGGPLSQELARTVAETGLGAQVIFHGTLGRAQLASRMAEANVYVHPSLKESFSFALLEAKFAGLRTVAHEKLEVPAEFIDQPVATWDAGNWASAIRQVLMHNPASFPSEKYDLRAFAGRLKAHLQSI